MQVCGRAGSSAGAAVRNAVGRDLLLSFAHADREGYRDTIDQNPNICAPGASATHPRDESLSRWDERTFHRDGRIAAARHHRGPHRADPLPPVR